MGMYLNAWKYLYNSSAIYTKYYHNLSKDSEDMFKVNLGL